VLTVLEVTMPRVDVMMQSGRIVQWLKVEGENVQKAEPLVLVEAEKTTFEVEAQESGVLRKILKGQEEDVPVGEALALIGSPDEAIPGGYTTKAVTPEAKPSIEKPSLPGQEGKQPPSKEIMASPAARSLARQRGIHLTEVKGTGRGGSIRLEDVQKSAELLQALPSEMAGTTLRIKETVPLTGIRKTVAERLSHSFHTAVPAMLTTEVDFETLEETRKKIGSTVSLTAFVVKSVATSLREHLILNSSLEGERIVVYDDINIAVAVNTPSGLTAPVVFEAERKSLGEITKDIADLRERAHSGRLNIKELTGGTFTVTNLGAEGIEVFAPIINPPQAAILAMGRASKKPVAVGNSVQIRSRATLSLVFDHRVTDGVPAAQFLAHVKQLLENPVLLNE
jgi:pyruvate dehydrogenase E2 component (dihydrolipoamide acetyltransferase)